jgi:hypothetical protein
VATQLHHGRRVRRGTCEVVRTTWPR